MAVPDGWFKAGDPMEALGPRSWNPTRQCTATARSGERCQRNAHPGSAVCILHGAGSPQAQEAAKRRLIAMVEPILTTFEEIVEGWHRTRCATCGLPTGDPAPVIRVGALVLDRAGLHPTLTVQSVPIVEDRYAHLNDEQLLIKLDETIARLTAHRDRILHNRASMYHGGAIDGDVIDEGFVVPDNPDDPAWSSPHGDSTMGAETPEKPKETCDD